MLKVHGECLQEECAEVIQAVSKIFRFGLNHINPVTNVSNKKQLEEELDQLSAMITVVRRHYSLGHDQVAYFRKENRHYEWLEKFPQTDTINE